MNVTDHSPAVGFGMGLDAGRLHAQIERVRALAATLRRGSRCSRAPRWTSSRDGSLDYSDELLAQLDVVVASVHASHRLSAADQTKRVCAAMENPHVDILGHPTGRLIGRRRPNPLDIEAVVAKAVETGTALEVSGQPHRLDLSDPHVRLAVEAGAKLAIDTDAHSAAALDYLPLRRHERPQGLGRRRRRGQHAVMAGAAGAARRTRPAVSGVKTTSPTSTSVGVARRHHHDVGPEELTSEGGEHVDDARRGLGQLGR